MALEDRVRLVKMLVALGCGAAVGSLRRLEEIASSDPGALSPEQLRHLASVAREAARLLEAEAGLAEAAA